jgi:hypothetical protein
VAKANGNAFLTAWVVGLGLSVLLSGCSTKAGKEKATVTFIQGQVEVRLAGRTDWRAAEIGMSLTQEDIIRTLDNSRVDVSFGTKGGIRLEPNSQLSLAGYTKNSTLLDLAVGKVLVTSEKLAKNSSFEVKTPTTVASITGTQFLVEVAPEKVEEVK